MNSIFFAFLSAVFAAGVAILGKLGLKDIDSTLATTVRSIIMATFLFLVSLSLGKFAGFSINSLNSKQWALIAGSGIAGALSWLFYFFALKTGNASMVSAIDRLSLIFVVILAAIFLGEQLSWRVALGALSMVAGTLLIVLK
jgi:transporter family protein